MLVKTIRGKGRGVFADKGYAKGELVLGHEILPVPAEESSRIEASFLNSYIFYMSGIYFIALGEGSLLNHAEIPNLDYRFAKRSRRIEFHAIRPIQKGDELTIDYDWEEYPWESKHK